MEAVGEELQEPRSRTGIAKIPRVGLSRIVVKLSPDIVGPGSIDTFLAVDETVEMAVLLDET